jgi:glycogen(starch) synthase
VLLAPSAYYPNVGGIEELTRQLALALLNRGHEAAVLTNRWPDDVPQREILAGVRVTRLRFPLPGAKPMATARFLVEAPSAAAKALRHVRRWTADVVHVIGAGPQSVYLGMLSGHLRAPLVFTAQGELTFDAHRAFEQSVILRAGLRRTVRRAALVTACSAFTLQNLMAFVDVDGPSIVIPNGVDPAEFEAPTFGEVRAIEDQFGRYVLAVGRLVPQKGFDLLIDAFAAAELADLQLVIAGDGFERDALTLRASNLGILQRVHLIGAVGRDHLRALLHAAQAFAFPSRAEPFGIALLEAMAAGTPSVVAAAGGVTEFVRDGENALTVPPDQVGALVSALSRVVTDRALRGRLSAGGVSTARDLAWVRIVRYYEDAYAKARRSTDRGLKGSDVSLPAPDQGIEL